MIKTSKKDVLQHKKTAYPTTTSAADKQFEDDVQERIRQAKMQLKASSPFLSDDEKKALENTFITETPNTIKDNANNSNEANSLNELQETLSSVQSANQHLNLDLRKAQERIADLEKDLKAKTNQVEKSEKPSPQYGGGGLANGNDVMTKNDLKIEFLNFTSAHIDQFNNRIKKTEDIVANYVKNAPQEQKTQKLAPQWLPWFNAILLGITSLLLIAILFNLKSAKNNSQLATSEEENSSAPKTDISNATIISKPEKKNEARVKTETINNATPVAIAVAAKPNKEISNKATAAESTPINKPIAITKPIEKSTPIEVAKPVANAISLKKSEIISRKPLPSNTPATRPLNSYISPKPIAKTIVNTPTPPKTTVAAKVENKIIVNNAPIQQKPIATTNKSTQQVASKTQTQNSKPVIAKNIAVKNNSKRINDIENNNLREALQPVDNTAKRKTNTASTQKKTSSKESVYFGED